jgi:uncharacterized protein YqgC (DUF456 family)
MQILSSCSLQFDMTALEYTALGISSLVFLIGLAGSFLPIVPGSLIVWIGVIVHKLWIADGSVTWLVVVITGVLMGIGQLADFYMGIWGARKFGASWKGAVGAFLGALIGFFIPPPILWLIMGPIVGAIVGELVAGRSFGAGSKAGIGTVVGGILAFALKFGISLSVIFLFFLDLFLI